MIILPALLVKIGFLIDYRPICVRIARLQLLVSQRGRGITWMVFFLFLRRKSWIVIENSKLLFPCFVRWKCFSQLLLIWLFHSALYQELASYSSCRLVYNVYFWIILAMKKLRMLFRCSMKLFLSQTSGQFGSIQHWFR